jgi:hypothetical protein
MKEYIVVPKTLYADAGLFEEWWRPRYALLPP